MTREEAEERAKSMPRIKALVDFRNNVVDTEWKGIDILLPEGKKAKGARLVFDSDLDRKTMPEEEAKLRRPMFHNLLLHRQASYPPKTLVKDFDFVLKTAEGEKTVEVRGNHQRLVRVVFPAEASEVTLRLLTTWGCEEVRVFAFDLTEA